MRDHDPGKANALAAFGEGGVMKVDIEKDVHLQNLLRHVRDRLLANNPVQAYMCLHDLENYLHGRNMDGSEILK